MRKRKYRLLDGIQVPSIIGHGYIPIKIIEFNKLYSQYHNHSRLRVFANKGCKCVAEGCEREGIYLIAGKAKDGQVHVDLYTKEFHLMTIDHRIPKSKGGSNSIKNLDPMCDRHNRHKGAKTPEEFSYNEHFIK